MFDVDFVEIDRTSFALELVVLMHHLTCLVVFDACSILDKLMYDEDMIV